MTPLRQRMTEDMQVRNLALNTQTAYLRQVSPVRTFLQQVPRTSGPGGHPDLPSLPDQ